MRALRGWMINALLILTLLVVCASSKGWLGLPMPWVVLSCLGVLAALLLWMHRQKLIEILNRSNG